MIRHHSVPRYYSYSAPYHDSYRRPGRHHLSYARSVGRERGREDDASDPAVKPGSAESEGWSLLASGRHPEALRAFASEAASHPKQGIPKLGYALSAAASGNLSQGVWAMRRALRIDPDSLHYVTIDDQLRPLIQRLTQDYQRSLQHNAHDRDAALMLASLHYLLRDAGQANVIVERAIAEGDQTGSVVYLKRLIDRRNAEDSAPLEQVRPLSEPSTSVP